MYTKKKKPINMATGGLMSMPPFIAKQEDDKDKGISPYDINTPAEARQGLPSRLLAKSRTRFNAAIATTNKLIPMPIHPVSENIAKELPVNKLNIKLLK